jgi:putative sigma-54 modulation protein
VDGRHRDSGAICGSTVTKEACVMEVPIDFAIRYPTATDTDMLRLYAERRLDFALRRFETRIRHVVVRLDDTNGPKRGIDSRCSVTLQLRDGRHINVEAVTAWPYSSITLAAKRLNAALRRELDRAQPPTRPRRRSRFDAGAGM